MFFRSELNAHDDTARNDFGKTTVLSASVSAYADIPNMPSGTVTLAVSPWGVLFYKPVGENEKFILDAVGKELCFRKYRPLFTKILDMFGDIVDVFKIIAV